MEKEYLVSLAKVALHWAGIKYSEMKVSGIYNGHNFIVLNVDGEEYVIHGPYTNKYVSGYISVIKGEEELISWRVSPRD